MFGSATRTFFFFLLVALIGMCFYTLVKYPDTRFKDVFALFAQVTTGLLAYFIGKSTQDGKTTTSNTTEITTNTTTPTPTPVVNDSLPG